MDHQTPYQSELEALRANLALALQNIGMVDRATATWRSICELARDGDCTLDRRTHVLRQLNDES